MYDTRDVIVVGVSGPAENLILLTELSDQKIVDAPPLRRSARLRAKQSRVTSSVGRVLVRSLSPRYRCIAGIAFDRDTWNVSSVNVASIEEEHRYAASPSHMRSVLKPLAQRAAAQVDSRTTAESVCEDCRMTQRVLTANGVPRCIFSPERFAALVDSLCRPDSPSLSQQEPFESDEFTLDCSAHATQTLDPLDVSVQRAAGSRPRRSKQ